MRPKEAGETRWLHISDLHFSGNKNDLFWRSFLGPDVETDEDVSESDIEVLRRGGLRGLIRIAKVDCIVVTGDFFNRGEWDETEIGNVRTFLVGIYKACSDAGDWGWKDSEPMERLFFCPGNHDFPRKVSFMEKYSTVMRSNEVVKVARDSLDDGYAKLDSHRNLFVNITFEHFANSMKNIANLSQALYSNSATEPFILRVPGEGYSDILFAGLNTAILAGQPADNSGALEEALRCWLPIRNQVKPNYKHLQDVAKNYAAKMRCVDGECIEDEKRLSLPPDEDVTKLDLEVKLRLQPIVIVFGHHPVEFFSEAARRVLYSKMLDWGSKLYLCGHVHRPGGHFMPLDEFSNAAPNPAASIYQIAVGGFFPDVDDYSQTSVCIGSIKQHIELFHTYDYKFDLFVFTDSVLGNSGDWFKSTYTMNGLSYLSPQRTQYTGYSDSSEKWKETRQNTKILDADAGKEQPIPKGEEWHLSDFL